MYISDLSINVEYVSKHILICSIHITLAVSTSSNLTNITCWIRVILGVPPACLPYRGSEECRAAICIPDANCQPHPLKSPTFVRVSGICRRRVLSSKVGRTAPSCIIPLPHVFVPFQVFLINH